MKPQLHVSSPSGVLTQQVTAKHKAKKGTLKKATKAPKERALESAVVPVDPTHPAAELHAAESDLDVEDDDIMSGVVFDMEKLQVMKAKTMYEMVEDIDVGNGPVKMLFLTNAQADSISASTKTLRKLLEAFEIPPPKLVIDLIPSMGLRNSLNLYPADAELFRDGTSPELRHDRPPFLSSDDENETMALLETFMSDVILPLAASTQALILTSAMVGECGLAGALSRAYRQQHAKWGTTPPFTILSVAINTPILYFNSKKDAYWRALRRMSRAWRSRDKALSEMVSAGMYFGRDPEALELGHDLDPDARCFLIVDRICNNQRHFDAKPGDDLRTELMRFLAGSVPSIALRTAYTDKFLPSASDKTWQTCLNQANSGTELLLLDLRKRYREAPGHGWASRAEYIEYAWAKHLEACDALCAQDLCESFDVCSVAHAHAFLFGDFCHAHQDSNGRIEQTRGHPLHEAIRLARKERKNQVSSTDNPEGVWEATEMQVMDVARRLAGRIMDDCRSSLGEAREDEGLRKLHAQKAVELPLLIRNVLMNPHTHQVNIHDMDEARHRVNNLVQSDRLPKRNSLEGLLLLQQAWCECDIAHYLANRYKRYTKIVYVSQLMLAWLIIVVSQVQTASFLGSTLAASDVVFILAVVHGAMVSVEGLLRPRPKWQALRRGSSSLESMIWMYRTRVGEFRMCPHLDQRKPEIVLCRQLNEWTEDLMSAGDLQRSAWSKSYPPSIHRHHQCAGELKARNLHLEDGSILPHVDDHYSPLQPDLYIQFRLLERMRWYQKRLPVYTLHVWVFKIIVLLCTVACAVLARFGEPTAVVVITALSSSCTTWAEFVDATSKVERYTRAVRSMTRLLNWWKHLSEVEKASVDNIAQLITETEQAIAKEQANWLPSYATGQADSNRNADASFAETPVAKPATR